MLDVRHLNPWLRGCMDDRREGDGCVNEWTNDVGMGGLMNSWRVYEGMKGCKDCGREDTRMNDGMGK